MQEVGHAALAIIPSFKGFQGDLERGSSKAMLAAGTSGGAQFGDAAGRSAGARFSSHVKSAAKIAAVGLAAAGAVAFKFAGDSLEEARDAQKVGALTDAVIKSTGKSAKVTARDVGKLSERLSNMAGVDDELIQSGANVLLTFTKIRNETGAGNKIFDQATLAALNMSAALKTDLSGASIQVGKALNDPVKGVTALGRAGVQFSEDQKKAIAKMVESGDTLGAQKVILKELDTQFKGSARSQATESDKLKVAFGNLKEEVGTELIPVMDDLAVFLRKKGIPAAKDFFGWIKDDGLPALKEFGEDVKPVVKRVKDLVGFFGELPTGAKIASLGGALAGGLVIKHQMGKIFDRGGIANPMFVVVTNPGTTPDTTPDGKPKPGKTGLGAGTIAALTAVGLPILDDQYKKNPILTKSGDWAERMGNKLGLPNWFEGDNGGDLGVDKSTADWKGFFNSTANLGGGKTSPDLKRLADDVERSGDKAWGAARMFNGFTGELKGGDRQAVRLRDSLDRVGRTRVRPEVDTSSIEAALALFRQLPGMEGVVGPVDPSLLTPRAGVTNNFNGPMHVTDGKDITRQAQRKARERGLGGRP